MEAHDQRVNALDTETTATAKPSTARKLADAAHNVVDDAASKAEQYENQFRAKADEASAKVEATQEVASEQYSKAISQAETFVKTKPMAAAGIAFAAGILTSVLLRR